MGKKGFWKVMGKIVDPKKNGVAKAFSKDGPIVGIVERVPVVGLVASAGHAIAGDTDRARRAATSSATATVNAAVGPAGGAILAAVSK